MKNWISVCCWMALFLSGQVVADRQVAGSPLPNVIIFILDDVGQQDVGAFGNTVVQTPNMDALAAEGMRFDNAFLTTSSCSPSRASILTGKYPTATRAPNLDDPLPADQVSLPQLLHQAGYYTASVGKWHLGEAFKSHFDRIVDAREESGSADWLPELASRPKDKPFFFWFASKDAHEPYYWNPPLRRQDPGKLIIPANAEDNTFTRQLMAGYYDEIARADANIGKVIQTLREQGNLDNTIIIVLSDNGSQIGGAKTTLYDEGLKTPLIVRFPDAINSKEHVNAQLVSVVDIMPTILDLTGVSAVQGASGVSLVPTMKNPDLSVRNYIYAERNKHGGRQFERALRTNHFLYKRNYFKRKLCDPYADTLFDPRRPRDVVHEEFYDVQRDPQARENLVVNPEYRGDLNAARAQLSMIMAEAEQHAPPLILEQCPQRGWADRIQWPLQAHE